MKKVGIMSMQRIQNYGSFLQAYALKRILEEFCCDVQFVDYHPGETLVPGDGGTGLIRSLSKVFDVFKYAAPFQEKIRFIRYKKNFASRYYTYLGLSKEPNYSPEVDVLIIGADEVFNCVQNNTNVGFSPELFGQGSRAKTLISYAASFGNTTEGKLEQYGVRNNVAEWLKMFCAISVRDSNSGDIVKNLTGTEPTFHLDPVLAFDFIGLCKNIPKSVPEKKYMLLYGYSGRFTKAECLKIREYADSKGLKIFCIGGVQNCCDKFVDVNPFQVISYFQHADCVVTDTFHGVIMSVITHRQFAALVREAGYGNSQKMTDLLERLRLTDRRITYINKLSEMMERPIDYVPTDTIIKQERKRTYKYLDQWLK